MCCRCKRIHSSAASDLSDSNVGMQLTEFQSSCPCQGMLTDSVLFLAQANFHHSCGRDNVWVLPESDAL